MEITHFIHSALDELFADGPLADCFVVEIVESGRRGVTVYFDCDTGVSLDKCAQVSRFLESRLDEQQFHDGQYVLDVSSPGVDRPLTMWRQYPRHKGRKLLVMLKDEGRIEGKLKDVGLDSLELETGKAEVIKVPFGDIIESFVQISF